MKVISIPVLGSFVKYSDYENTVKTLQNVTTYNEELYKREQEVLLSLKYKEAFNLELQIKNIELYEDNAKLHSQLKQSKKEIELFWLGLFCIFIGNLIINFVN